MSWWQGLVLGVVQGLTEFLPISSSGHLVIVQELIGFNNAGVFVEVVLHVATLLAIVVVYRARIVSLANGLVRGDIDSIRYIGLIMIATIPAGAIGILFQDAIESSFGSLRVVGLNFLFTGVILWSSLATRPKPKCSVGLPAAVVAGFAQALAILPGISRSGSTIVGAMWLRVDPVRAAEFSFLMAIPVIGGAGVLQLGKLSGATIAGSPFPLMIGFAAALVSGVFAIRVLVRLLIRQQFHRFAGYCWLLGIVVISWSFYK